MRNEISCRLRSDSTSHSHLNPSFGSKLLGSHAVCSKTEKANVFATTLFSSIMAELELYTIMVALYMYLVVVLCASVWVYMNVCVPEREIPSPNRPTIFSLLSLFRFFFHSLIDCQATEVRWPSHACDIHLYTKCVYGRAYVCVFLSLHLRSSSLFLWHNVKCTPYRSNLCNLGILYDEISESLIHLWDPKNSSVLTECIESHIRYCMLKGGSSTLRSKRLRIAYVHQPKVAKYDANFMISWIFIFFSFVCLLTRSLFRSFSLEITPLHVGSLRVDRYR